MHDHPTYTADQLDYAHRLLIAAAEATDQPVADPQLTDHEAMGPMFQLESGHQIPLASLLNTLPADQAAHQDHATRWMAQMIAASQAGKDLAAMPREDILRRIRTRIMAQMPASVGQFSYGRDFAPGVVQLLSLESAESVLTLPDPQLEALAGTVPVEELFATGQANTDQARVEKVARIGEGIYSAEGNSFFLASRVANMGSLLRDEILPLLEAQNEQPVIDRGVLFGIPNRHTVIVAPVRGESFATVSTRVLTILDELRWGTAAEDMPGGPISGLTFYWDPVTDTVETFGGRTYTNGSQDTELRAFVGKNLRGHLTDLGIYDQILTKD